MSKHTPGPWEVSGATHVVHFGDDGANICTVSEPRPDDQIVGYHELELFSKDFHEACANAQLIAAAPDLLDALRAVVAISDRKHDAWDAAKAAIAKATNGSE